jgi:hypothetical protein
MGLNVLPQAELEFSLAGVSITYNGSTAGVAVQRFYLVNVCEPNLAEKRW